MNEPQKKHTLLLVEDNPLLLHAYQEAFEEKGIEVYVAYDGDVGLKFVRDEKPEVVLLDLSVHGMNGMKVLEQVKSDPATKDTIVIIFTMSGDEDNRKEALRLGANEYLIKSEKSLDDIMGVIFRYFIAKEQA